MNVLILGSGGRENALAWKIAQSEMLDTLYCMPGNPGTANLATNLSGDIKDFALVKEMVLKNGIEIVVVGPEDPLVSGIKDYFSSDKELSKVLFVGPCSKGAKLEGSKDFAKEFMRKFNIPTAAYKSFNIDNVNEADLFLESLSAPYVLKADGLAAGKGVLIIDDIDEAKREIREMICGAKFGNASSTVVIEEFLKGIEISIFVLTDGKDYLILPEAKDYKRIGDGDAGLNTGGMGAVSPVPFANEEFMSKVEERIIKPTISGFGTEGMDYSGFVFIGLMNCGGEPYVIEYNVRMGDPETEAVMTRIESDFLSHLKAAAAGTISKEKMEISSKTAVTLVTVSGGYPEEFEKGYTISGLSKSCKDVNIFHSGTKLDGDSVVTNGGRVLAITANAADMVSARELVYNSVKNIAYDNIYFRGDIGLDLINYQK